MARTRTPAVQRRYLTLTEAAEYYGCCERTLRRRIADGTLPARRLGKGGRTSHFRIAIEDLEMLVPRVPTAGQRSA